MKFWVFVLVSIVEIVLSILLIVAFLALTTRSASADSGTKIGTESKYVPMCFEHNCPEQTKNTVTIFSGPSTLKVTNQPNETLFQAGYLRRITRDLSLGVQVLGTDKRYLGTQFGFGYNF